MDDTAFWDKAAPKYAKEAISDKDAYNVTLGRMRHHLQPHFNVLELGCGTGSTALELSPGVASYMGTDVSSVMIDIARAKLTDDLPGSLSFQVGQAHDIPDSTYDAVLALNLLHLLPDVETTLSAIYDALPSGGLFIAKTALLKDGKWFLGLALPIMQFLGKAPSIRSMTEAELRTLLLDAGFEMIEDIAQPDIAPRLFTVCRKP